MLYLSDGWVEGGAGEEIWGGHMAESKAQKENNRQSTQHQSKTIDPPGFGLCTSQVGRPSLSVGQASFLVPRPKPPAVTRPQHHNEPSVVSMTFLAASCVPAPPLRQPQQQPSPSIDPLECPHRFGMGRPNGRTIRLTTHHQPHYSNARPMPFNTTQQEEEEHDLDRSRTPSLDAYTYDPAATLAPPSPPPPAAAMPVQLKGITVRVDPPKMPTIIKAPAVPASAVVDSSPQDNLRRTGAFIVHRSIDRSIGWSMA